MSDPPAPTPPPDVAHARRIEEASLRAWPALTESDFDGWRLRFADGYTRRANSITPLDPSRLALDDKIATCERLYADRALPAIFRLTPFAPPDLRERLLRRGYRAGDLVEVRARPLGAGVAAEAGRADADVRAHDLDEWLDIFADLGRSSAASRAPHRAVLAAVPGTLRLLALWVGDQPLACGMAALTDDLLGLFDLVTAPEERNRGYGTALLRSALAWGHGAGAREAYLQVLPRNTAALRIYARAGFDVIYSYEYLEPGR